LAGAKITSVRGKVMLARSVLQSVHACRVSAASGSTIKNVAEIMPSPMIIAGSSMSVMLAHMTINVLTQRLGITASWCPPLTLTVLGEDVKGSARRSCNTENPATKIKIASMTCAGGMRGSTIKGVVRKNRITIAGTSIIKILAIRIMRIKTTNVNQDGAMVMCARRS
jgi:hypothetical protein